MDAYLKKESEKVRDYGDYWSASSVGYCYRYNILKRIKLPPVPEIADNKERQQRVFSAGHIFHNWAQELTRNAGISLAQEEELIDHDLMVKGHFDDIVLLRSPKERADTGEIVLGGLPDHMVLIDYKTVNSKAFNYTYEMKSTHRLQLGTYLYMLRKIQWNEFSNYRLDVSGISEARIVEIEKDALRMREGQLLWNRELEHDVLTYWQILNTYWFDYTQSGKLPDCKCAEMVGVWMAKRTKDGRIFNDYFLNGKPCSQEWVEINKKGTE